MKYNNTKTDRHGYTDLDIIEIYIDIIKGIDQVERPQVAIDYIKDRFISLIK